MITSTMTLDEKQWEAVRTWYDIIDFSAHYLREFTAKLKKQSNSGFPYYNRHTFTDDKLNVWKIVFYCPSKLYRKKGLYLSYAYTVYEVPPNHKENRTNFGKGVLLYFPENVAQWFTDKLSEKTPKTIPAVIDIVPHAINRYTERYLKPKGLENISIDKKVENIVSSYMHFDIAADIYGDISTKKNMKEGAIPYDFILKGGGMLRGNYHVDADCIQFYTYISNEMLYNNQLDRQVEMRKEYYKKYNPIELKEKKKYEE